MRLRYYRGGLQTNSISEEPAEPQLAHNGEGGESIGGTRRDEGEREKGQGKSVEAGADDVSHVFVSK